VHIETDVFFKCPW